jgi:dipeptidyl aminopeptidase/acylaminoacyl peptidase
MKRLLLFAALLCMLPAFAQQKFTPEILWKFGRLSDPQLSPDGKKVLYGVRNTDMKANKSYNTLYTISVDGGTPAKVLDASDNGFEARWSADGKKITYMAVTKGEAQVWEMNPDGSDRKQLTNIKGGINFYKFSPNGAYMAYGQDVQVDKTVQEMFPNLPLDKTTGRVYDALNIRHWDTWMDGSYWHIFYAPVVNGGVITQGTDINKGESYDSPRKPFVGEEGLAWAPDNSSIVYSSKKLKGTEYANSTNSDLYMYHLNTGKTDDLTTENPGYDENPLFSPDGKYIAYLSMEHASYESDKNRLMLLDLKDNKKTDLSAGFDQPTDNIEWAKDSKTLYFISETQATQQVYAYKLGAKKNAITQLTDGYHDYTDIHEAKDGKKIILIGAKMSLSFPPELYRIDPDKKKETQLTYTNKQLLSQIKMGRVVKRMVKATDGKQILTWVVYPPDFDSTRKYKALLYCQGGPQSAVSQFWSTRWNLQLMAADDYIIVAPNRRGLPSFGQEWNDAIVGDYGGQPMQDMLSAIDDVAKEPYIDKNKLGAVGASFGGYTVYWLAGHNENKRFKTFIAHDGMFDMVSWYGSTEEMWFANHDQRGSYWSNQTNYQKFSPHNFVGKWNAPILIISNEKDYRVPVEQGIEAFTAAQEQGITSRFLSFPDENHWVLKPQNSLLWHTVFLDWLDKTLK